MPTDHLLITAHQYSLPLIGGLLFTLILYFLGYAHLNPENYTLRDDGIIIFSHAKNWVDYGFIGVSPSGGRVEGFSAPVAFFIYAAIYWLTGAGFAAYIKAQTLISTFILGMVLTLYFKDKKYFALLATSATAVCLTQLTSFMQWHGSGMENAITHALFALTVYILFKFARDEKITLSLAMIPFLASISRLDSLYHILPLLFIFAAYWALFAKNAKGVLFLALSMLLWFAFNLWRWCYFGDLLPNTAYAQAISLVDNLAALFSLQSVALQTAMGLSKAIFAAHGGLFILLILPFLPLVNWKKPIGLLFLLSLSLIITATFNPFLFGPTRLDITRTTTQMAYFVCVAICCIIYTVVYTANKHCCYPCMLLLLIPAGGFMYHRSHMQSYEMCCSIMSPNPLWQAFAKISHRENLPRPTIANPDLGIMSWQKLFNIVDLGMLGSPLIAKLKNGPLLADYFLDYAAPDIIESHGSWTERYHTAIFTDPRFSKNYMLVKDRTGNIWWQFWSNDKTMPPDGVWVRKAILKQAASPERILIDDLATHGPSVERLARELAACQASHSPPTACVYVARTAYRFLPEFRALGKVDQLVATFQSSRTRDFDLFLITGFRDGTVHQKALAFIAKNSLANRIDHS